MKTSEIMLGDYFNVHPSNLPIKVAAIHKGKVGYHARKDRLEWVRVALLRPIIITKDLLVKIGFTYCDATGQCILFDACTNYTITVCNTCIESRNIQVHIDEEVFNDVDGIIEMTVMHLMKCNYLHQLQHVMMVCRINKIIEI